MKYLSRLRPVSACEDVVSGARVTQNAARCCSRLAGRFSADEDLVLNFWDEALAAKATAAGSVRLLEKGRACQAAARPNQSAFLLIRSSSRALCPVRVSAGPGGSVLSCLTRCSRNS